MIKAPSFLDSLEDKDSDISYNIGSQIYYLSVCLVS